MNLPDKLAAVIFAGLNLWVAWELWSGHATTLTRWPSDPDGWARATQFHKFDRREEPTFYWMAWGYKAAVLAMCWCCV